MKESVKKALKSVVTTFSPELTCRILFYSAFRRRLDTKNPKTLDEKLCTMKITEYAHHPLIPLCVDKYRVREYVTSKGLGSLLNECYAVYERPDDIDWEALPQSFVLKCNHGCGYNILCPSKKDLDIPAARRRLKRWMREDYWRLNAELNYRGIPKRIICEKYLCSEEHPVLKDYKVYCFHGKPYCMMVCVGRGEGKTRFYFFDPDWNLLRINPDSIAAPEGLTVEKPAGVREMFEYARILSEDFRFVRVDFFQVGEKIIFGEMTFTPASGMDKNRLPETDRLLGSMLHLD